jgi:hypothetical protein
MRLSIQYPLIQTDLALIRKQQIKVLQRFREPEALHGIVQLRHLFGNIIDSRVTKLSSRRAFHGLEHAPPGFAPVVVARDAVHVPYGLDCFGSVAC